MTIADGSAVRLLAEILSSYSSLDAFLADLNRELEAPTQELPRIDFDTPIDQDPTRRPDVPVVLGPNTSHGRHAARS